MGRAVNMKRPPAGTSSQQDLLRFIRRWRDPERPWWQCPACGQRLPHERTESGICAGASW